MTRIRRLRSVLNRVGGGTKATADDVASVLMRTLDEAQQTALYDRMRTKREIGENALWASLGKAMVHQILGSCAAMSVFLVLLCISLRHTGITRYHKIRETMGIELPRATWRRTRSMTKIEPLHRSNGRLGYRKLPREAAIDLSNSNSVESSDFVRGRKRKHADPCASDEAAPKVKTPKIAKNLTDSKTQL